MENIRQEMTDWIVKGYEVCPECAVYADFYDAPYVDTWLELYDYLCENDVEGRCWDL